MIYPDTQLFIDGTWTDAFAQSIKVANSLEQGAQMGPVANERRLRAMSLFTARWIRVPSSSLAVSASVRAEISGSRLCSPTFRRTRTYLMTSRSGQ